jgi:adenylosuccinate synthase
VTYNIEGKQTDQVPFQLMQVNVVPGYKAFEGWNCDSTSLKNSEKLPGEMQRYISFINQYVKAPVSYVSNGPQREQIIKIQE